MNESHNFYQRQNKLSNVYTGDIQDYHHERATLITKQKTVDNPTVLELGAGGGQQACATALAGYETTMIELVTSFTDHAKSLSEAHNISNLTILNGDFYTIKLDKTFDVITYWDGFGIGTDNDQIRLLKRCRNWLNPDGVILMDIYTPWYWSKVAGHAMQFGDTHRQYGFDVLRNCMLDTWWHTTSPDEKVTQSLRCYSPADLKLLLADTDLVLDDMVETGGAVDYEAGTYTPHVELGQAMSYVARFTIQPADSTHLT